MKAPIAMPFNPTSHRRRNKLKVEGAINIIVNENLLPCPPFVQTAPIFSIIKAVWIYRQARFLAVASCPVRRTVAITITNFFVLHDSFSVSINGVGHLQLY